MRHAGLLAIVHDFERVSLQKSLQCRSCEAQSLEEMPTEVNSLGPEEGTLFSAKLRFLDFPATLV
jgi:hypothetical protein